MKNIFYACFLCIISISSTAQTPGGISGASLWLKANSGASAAAWNDNSGANNHFTQANPTNQPVLANNVFNFNAALQFDGLNSFMEQPSPNNFPENNSDRTIFVVAQAAATTGYRWIFVYGTTGYPPGGGTCQMGNHNGTLTNAYYGSPADLSSGSYWDAAANINGGLAAFTLNGTLETQYDRGLSINTLSTVATLTATSTNGIIGALNNAPNEAWGGSIGEVIMFNTALSDADRHQVEAYLALKYGFTLGNTGNPVDYTASDGSTVYWTGSATFQNDVFGIGTDNGTGLVQTQSNSMNSGSGDGTGQSTLGNLVLGTGSALADKQFLVIGNDGFTMVQTTISAGQAQPIAVGSTRVSRNWKVQNTGAVGAVDLSIDAAGLSLNGGTDINNYRLMIDQDGDGDYSTGTISYIKPASIAGNLLNFPGITLPNNAVFTLITQTSALLPAIWQGFTVTLQKNKATLTWKTSNEINVDHYSAEYSVNGNNYTAFANVTAANGSGINTYSASQDNLPAGVRYYRIRRVDKDGQSQLSEVKTVRPGGFSTVVLKANPIVKNKLDLLIDVPQSQSATIRVISISGKLLVQQNTGLSGGSNNVSTNLGTVAKGTYFLQVQLANDIITKKFVKL